MSFSIEKTQQSLASEGWCIIEDVVPRNVLYTIHQASLTLVKEQRIKIESWHTEQSQRGWQGRITGVEKAEGVVEAIPQFAPYVANRRIMDVVEANFGPHVRVSSTSVIVTNPYNQRGYWHADWPFNQTIASHIPAPYSNSVIHISTIFMITDFSADNGGTLIVPRSHQLPKNPSGDNDIDCKSSHPNEINVTGTAGSVFLYDSRLWHSVAPNYSKQPRVAISVRYAPWWLNLDVRRKGSPDYVRIVNKTNGKDNSVPLLSKASFDALPENTKPLFSHWVER
ncbi:MAG: phytanoyl-CoA dioxygenase family protein [Cyanobacteria bacterium P01_G01_bin.54]